MNSIAIVLDERESLLQEDNGEYKTTLLTE